MSVKSVIGIEVDDSAFKRFREIFSAYSDEVDKMPEAWQKLNAVIADSAKGLESGALNAKDAFAAIAAQAGIVGVALRDAVKIQNKLGQATSHSQKAMNGLQKSTQGVSNALKNVGGWIVRIGAVAGLGGVLGGIGFGDLANATFNRSRSSGRLGLSPGQLSSFDVNLQQFMGREALEGAVNAQGDVTKGGALAALGLNQRSGQGIDSVVFAAEMQKRALAIYQSEKNSGMYLNDPRLQMYQSQLGGSIEELRNADLHGGSKAIDAAIAKYLHDKSSMEIPQKEQQEWIELKKTLDRAGQTIQTVFIDKLHSLAPDIDSLVGKFVDLVKAFSKTKLVDDAIHGLHSGLDWLNRLLEPKNLAEAHKEFDSMVATVRKFGAELKVIVDKFSWILPHDNTAAEVADAKRARLSGAAAGDAFNGYITDRVKPILGMPKNLMTSGEILWRRLHGDYNPTRIYAINRLMSKKYSIPPGLMDRLAMDESGYGTNMVSSAGALGPYQFMPGTAQGYGINPLDTLQSAGAAGKMLSSLFRKYHDWKKVIAAYNMGQGALDDDINGYRDRHGRWHSGHGSDWLKYTSDETQGEVRNVVGENSPAYNSAIVKMLGKVINKHVVKPVHVTVHNSTAARVSVSANAVALG